MIARILRSIRTIEGAMIEDERPSQIKSKSGEIQVTRNQVTRINK